MNKKTAHKLRRKLSKPGLLKTVRDCFEEIEDAITGRSFTLTDYLMSGLAVFSLCSRADFKNGWGEEKRL